MSVTLGNLLGTAQAEADQFMLQHAFIETPDYQALLHTTDYNYVVGRRGTGKSAIYQRLRADFEKDTGLILIAEEPQDYEMLEFHSLLSKLTNEYRVLRPISRLLWTVHLLMAALVEASKHYRFNKSKHADLFSDYLDQYKELLKKSGPRRCIDILRNFIKEGLSAPEIPHSIAERYRVGKMIETLREALNETQLRIIALYDRLDESWIPDAASIAILGGLTRTAADARERRFPLYPVLFIRDNMFRALAQLDDDFTRHIEGHTLRLHWDESALFHFVAARLRVALKIEQIESEARVWNRFAYRELHDKEGFAKCLRLTLYRPRDILVLLNEAYSNARRDNRDAIIEKDVEISATSISQHRLEDLCKEYDKVLPGLRIFVSAFRGYPSERTFSQVVAQLDDFAAHNDYAATAARDLALFENGGEMFSALYSVGFVGLRDQTTGTYTFCHDGTVSALVSLDANRETLVHPCYWKALDISVTEEQDQILIQTNDEYEVVHSNEPRNLRLQRLGRLPEELGGIPTGYAGSRGFEAWVSRAVKLLFSGSLANIELKPNPATALNQRDVVATNTTQSTFWRRVYEDYQSRQVMFECKNYEEVTPDDFRQVSDYSTGEYGRFAVIVRRGGNDILTENEKDRVKDQFFNHKKLILIVPVALFALCIRKLRTPKKYDYAEFTMSKHMDYIVRSVLSLTHAPKYKQKRRKSP